MDAVLLNSYLCDTLLSIAEEGVYRPLVRACSQIQPRERASWTASWRLAAPSLAAAEER
jgi:hypothetical protein